MRKMILLGTLLALLLSACQTTTLPQASSPTVEPVATQPPASATPTQEPTPTGAPAATLVHTAAPTLIPQPVGPNSFAAGINPLTGLAVSDPALLERRPLAVKVQLFPRSGRPPYGVALADAVYHYYQNAGITRLHAIFYGNDAEKVMPVRSARLFDAQLIWMYKSIFAFGGADSRIYNRLVNTDFGDRLILEGGAASCPPMCREDPSGYNFLWTNTAELEKYAEKRGVDNPAEDLTGTLFDPETPSGGEAGEAVSVRYSISAYTRWEYDADTGKYTRLQDTTEASTPADEVYAPLVDGATNQPLTADNVIILFSEHTYEFNSRPGNNEVIRIPLEGTGRALAFRDGQMYELTWNRPAGDAYYDLFTLTFEDGAQYPYKPGNSWYEVVGQSSTLSTENGLRVQFSIP